MKSVHFIHLVLGNSFYSFDLGLGILHLRVINFLISFLLNSDLVAGKQL